MMKSKQRIFIYTVLVVLFQVSFKTQMTDAQFMSSRIRRRQDIAVQKLLKEIMDLELSINGLKQTRTHKINHRESRAPKHAIMPQERMAGSSIVTSELGLNCDPDEIDQDGSCCKGPHGQPSGNKMACINLAGPLVTRKLIPSKPAIDADLNTVNKFGRNKSELLVKLSRGFEKLIDELSLQESRIGRR